MLLVRKDEILRCSRRIADVPIIYFLIAGKDIVYVGKSLSGFARIKSHINNDRMAFDSYYILNCRRKRIDRVERAYIRYFKPKYNKALNPKIKKKFPHIVEMCNGKRVVRINYRKQNASIGLMPYGFGKTENPVLWKGGEWLKAKL